VAGAGGCSSEGTCIHASACRKVIERTQRDTFALGEERAGVSVGKGEDGGGHGIVLLDSLAAAGGPI